MANYMTLLWITQGSRFRCTLEGDIDVEEALQSITKVAGIVRAKDASLEGQKAIDVTLSDSCLHDADRTGAVISALSRRWQIGRISYFNPSKLGLESKSLSRDVWLSFWKPKR